MVRFVAQHFIYDEEDRKYYADSYSFCPPPCFIVLISLIELGFFVYYSASDEEWSSSSNPVLINSPFIYRPDKREEIHRFVTYMLLHASWYHVSFNLLVQLIIGLPLELVHGFSRIAVVYMSGVLAGSLATSIFDPKVYLVGSSGGVYALLAGHLANVVLNHNQMEFGFIRIFAVFAIASSDIGFAIYDRYMQGEDATISFISHFAGSIAGLTIGLIVLKNFEQKLREQFIWWMAVGVYAVFVCFAIIYNILN